VAAGLARLIVGADPRRTLVRVGILVIAAWLLVSYGILSVRGQGPSMLPTIRDGQLMIVDTISYRIRRPRRGELAAVRWVDDRAVLIKRIIAGPGDTIAIRDGVVEVNDVAIDEPYVQHRARWNMAATTLLPDQFFVVGDNRGMPMAQHTLGTVERALLIGPVFWIVGG
jgi:signal peptidase I